MQDNEKKPALRFKGFTDPWEQRKFGEVVDKYEDPVETPHDGYYRLGIRSHAKGTFHSYVEKGHELETAQMYRVAAGNFIVNITFGWEHAVAITNESDAGKLVSHRFPQYSFHDDMLPEFFKYVIADEDFRHWLWLASPGGAGRNRVLKLDEMLNYEMVLPSKEEQQRIAAIFCNLDALITLHQRKYEKLVNIKKSMLDKMFPQNGASVPEIRFKGFTDPWEQRKLGDLCVEFRSGEFISASDITETGEYPVFGGNGLRGFTDRFNHDGEYTLIGRQEALCGNVNFAVGKSYFTEHAIAVRADKKNQTRFLYYLFSTMDLGQYSGQSAQPGLAVGNLVELKSTLPDKQEQEKISGVLTALDTLITLHQRKLEKLQNIKKSCLEKMFV